MKKGLIFSLVAATLSLSSGLMANDVNERLSDEVSETVKKSQEMRKQMAQTKPQRDLASFTKEEEKLHQEFESLMAQDDDQAWFEKVDSLMK